MLYQRTLVIPANTVASSPASETLKLAMGTITRMEVEFPGGCVGLVGVRVRDAGWQIMPWTRDEWLVSDDFVLSSESSYPLTRDRNTLTIRGYNTDTVNDHTVQLRVILQEGESEEFPMLAQFLGALRGW